MPILQLSLTKLSTIFHLAKIVQLILYYYSDAWFTMVKFY